MSDHEPVYSALGRAVFLIERACVPRYYPSPYCAEMGQIWAAMEAAICRNKPPEDNSS